MYEDSDGKFSVGETITGQTSKATATILIDDLRNGRMFISAQQQFINGETIVGATSTAEGTVKKYRGNPVQTIQQLLEFKLEIKLKYIECSGNQYTLANKRKLI